MDTFFEYYIASLKLLIGIHLNKIFPNEKEKIRQLLKDETFNNSLLSLFDDMTTRYDFRGSDLFTIGLNKNQK